MACIYREKYRKPLPKDAEIFERRGKKMVRWIDGLGRTQVAELEKDGKRIVLDYKNYFARYRDADGITRRVTTGCRDKQAAERVLANLISEAEKVKAGIISREESRVGGHADKPLESHVQSYITHLRACERCESHIKNTRSAIMRVAKDCSFNCLRDLDRMRAERWLLKRSREGMSARARNSYRIALVAFGNWCVRESRLLVNPFAGLARANEAADQRRKRRALTVAEVGQLLKAAEKRPLREAMMIRRGKHKGQPNAKVSDATRRKLKRWGCKRALFYRIAVYTGLRVSEIKSLTIVDAHLDSTPPYLRLHAKHDKARRGAKQPLPQDLAKAIRDYLADRLLEAQEEAVTRRQPVPLALSPDEKLIPKAPNLRTFDKDLELAGIPKKDEHGRTVDLHGLRHTFGTLLARSGVHPRTAMELMRHSDIRLTTKIYQHLELVDTAQALNHLPAIASSVDHASSRNTEIA